MVRKVMRLCAFIAAASMVFPATAGAGGWSTKDKIQRKLNVAPSNMQYSNERVDAAQYEPYYVQQAATGGRVEVLDANAMYLGRELEGQQVMSNTVNLKGAADKKSPEPLAVRTRAVVAPYLIYRTSYNAELEDDVVTVKGNALFEVFNQGWTAIPLVRSDVGLIDVKLSRGTSFVTMQGSRYNLMVDKPGRYSLDFEFLIKAHREREGGPGNFNLEVMPAPISQFELKMPDTDVEVFIDPSIKTEIKKEQKSTTAWAVMPNTNSIQVRWTKAIAKETIAPVKLEPKVYVDTTTYAAIGDAVIRSQSVLSYSILQSEVSSFRVALPEDVSVLGVLGDELRDWKVTQDKGTQYVDVYLNFGVRGPYNLTLNYERKIGDGSGIAQIPWVRAMAVEREKGFYGIAAATNVELAVNKAENVSTIDVRELPQSIWASSTNPILLAFKYLKQPVGVEIEVTKHEEVPVLVAAVDSVEYVTLLTDEGKSVTKAVYQVRNNVKQFLHVDLPQDSTLWSVFVAGKPVKPARNKEGSILVPLEKSRLSGQDLTRFPVELVYASFGKKFQGMGRRSMGLPRIDLPASTLQWNVFLPKEFAYLRFGGTVKPSRGSAAQFGQSLPTSRMYASLRESVDYVQQGVAQKAVMPEETYGKGMLPIKIDIPQEGQLYRFSKLLVTDRETPFLTMWYVFGALQLAAMMRFVIFLAVVACCWWLVRKIARGPKSQAKQ
jgi:hypothetical protein